MALTADDAELLEWRIGSGGVVLYGTDTVYGLACDPDNVAAVARVAGIKGRPTGKPSAILYFTVEAAADVLDELAPVVQQAARALLPGAVTLVVANPGHRFPLVCGGAPETLGFRVPELTAATAALSAVRRPIAQSSANRAGGAEARRLQDVDPGVRSEVDAILDAGELPGVASTVIDLRGLEDGGTWTILREGAVSAADVAARLG